MGFFSRSPQAVSDTDSQGSDHASSIADRFGSRASIPQGKALLEVRDLKKWYGRRQVVDGVSFEVHTGEIVGLLGPNGAGKTTSFRMTIGLIDANDGMVLFDGHDITHLPMYQRARLGMGYLPQDSSVFRQLSVEQNLMAILEYRADYTRKRRKERLEELLDQFGLQKIRRTAASRVSGGERRRLEIARCLVNDPKLIMLDEPFAGIDPKTVKDIQQQILDLAKNHNIGILLTDHQFSETLEVCNRSYVIREGRVFAYGTEAEIYANKDVAKFYLGEHNETRHKGHAEGPQPHVDSNPAHADSGFKIQEGKGPVRFDGP